MSTVQIHGKTFRVIPLEDCQSLAEGLRDMGKKWHSHVLSPICDHNPFEGNYAVVVEDDAEGVPYIAEGTTEFPEVDKVLVQMLHGSDILDASKATGADVWAESSTLLARIRELQRQGALWHHHMHFPECAFNPHPGEWSISVESDIDSFSEAYPDEPVDVLREVEVLYFANLAASS